MATEEACTETETETGTTVFGIEAKALRTLVVLCIINFLVFCSYPIPSPFLPGVLTERGVSHGMIGIIFSSMTAAMFVLSPFVSLISSKFSRKTMFVGSLTLEAFCIACFAFIDRLEGTTLVGVAITLRVIAGIGATVCETLSISIVVDVVPPDKVTKIFGLMEMFAGLGLMTGPPLGGLLFQFFGFETTFFINAGLLLVTIVLSFFWLPSTNSMKPEEDVVHASNLLTCKWVWIGMLAPTLACASWGLLDTTLELHLAPFGLNPFHIGLMLLIPAATYLIFSPIVGLFEFPGPKPLVLLGFLFLCVGTLLLGPSPFLFFLPRGSLVLDSISLLLIGLGSAFTIVPCLEMVTEEVSSKGDVTDAISGLLSSAVALGNTVGPFLGSSLTGAVGFEWCTSIFSAITGAAIILYFIMSMNDLYIFSRENKSEKEDDDFFPDISTDAMVLP
eukprot:TRINITY_DN2612_c0_g1_i1.p1 TRINITY_DN2612_c0_g1~~TRINITY_DN2612_c0_g1_i1.p1  ORF type:complete len:447 (-),score=63.61 TRINITY_DN2612_c0_g1_i1:55-1395(-)